MRLNFFFSPSPSLTILGRQTGWWYLVTRDFHKKLHDMLQTLGTRRTQQPVIMQKNCFWRHCFFTLLFHRRLFTPHGREVARIFDFCIKPAEVLLIHLISCDKQFNLDVFIFLHDYRFLEVLLPAQCVVCLCVCVCVCVRQPVFVCLSFSLYLFSLCCVCNGDTHTPTQGVLMCVFQSVCSCSFHFFLLYMFVCVCVCVCGGWRAGY